MEHDRLPTPQMDSSGRQATPLTESPERSSTPQARSPDNDDDSVQDTVVTITETKTKQQTVEMKEVDPNDYGIKMEEEEEFKFEPLAEDDTLPDLYNLMATLENGDTELETERQPPSLFVRPEHIPNYERISELRLELEKGELDPYLLQFEDEVRDDVVMLGSIALDEIQEEERRLRDEHVLYLDQEQARSRKQEERLLQREEEAKTRVARVIKAEREKLARREELMKQREKLLMDRLHKAFRRSESQLVSCLENRKGEVRTFYGDLMMADGQYGGSRGRRWKVDWNKTPQPIQIKLKCLRGVKDKLPAGRYVLMVSLYNRLAGHCMRWSKMKGQQWGGASLPIFHEGNFHNVEMKIEQSVFTVLPAKLSLRPGMALVFELFLLRGSVVSTDRVVSWGAFPICDGQFDIIEGKYRCPFLRGEMCADIDKHEKLEELMASDLDHWMSNLYFEIVKLPRYMAGQKEYEVELQFSSGLIGYPDRIKTGWEDNRDGEDPVPGSTSDMTLEMAKSQGSSQQSLTVKTLSEADTSRSVAATSKVKLREKDKTRILTPPTTIVSRLIHKETKKLKMEDSDTESEAEVDECLYEAKKHDDYKPVKGTAGMYYRRYLYNPTDRYYKKMFSMVPKTPILAPRNKKKKLTHVEQLEEHTFRVQPAFSGKGRMAKAGREKMSYIGRQFLAELGLSQWRSREFWGMVLMFLLLFFLRIYVHYCGELAFLEASGIPINKLEFLPYTVKLNYQPTLLRAREEIAVVVFGPLFNIFAFSFLVFLTWVCTRIFSILPDLFSKFVMCFGLNTFLDPIFILIVDCCMQTYQDQSVEPIADAAKLYWHFYRAQGSGLAGIFITVFLNLFTFFISGSILYMYFLRLHNNGRMLDVFWRLHGDEEHFFVPYDLELSNQELNYICHKAEQWRGEEGERRKVAVYDYIWEEEDIEESIWDESGEEVKVKRENRKEVTTHVAIHTIHLDGLRELHRHFLRLPDGAIVEVFGDISIPGMDKDVKTALEQGAKGLENFMGSQVSLHKVRGRQTVHTRSGFKDEGSSPAPSSVDSEEIKKTI